MNELVIVDYGMGNLRSVSKAFEKVGARVKISDDPKTVSSAERLVVPGVGAFKDAMRQLKRRGLTEAIHEFVDKGRPFLGLCLGLQLIFFDSEEGGINKGLGFIEGKVLKFPKRPLTMEEGAPPLKIPHMGWNQIRIDGQRTAHSRQKKNLNAKRYMLNAEKMCPLLKGIPDGSYMYFVHSYYAEPEDDDCVAAWTDYGIEFPSVVWSRNIYATQFHPEKSQKLGLEILRNFMKI
ncbi:MAG: imidazole glycerol phosphate synthase subunit HisH [Candidatus Omnitrophota bacterium]